jgi:hypothetical protein
MWTARKTHKGYGQFKLNYKTVQAHRLAYMITNGEIKNNILHICDNPSCVNPDHLRDGTQKENVADAIGKKRMFNQKKNSCKHGHAFTHDNTMIKYGKRYCRECARADSRLWHQKWYLVNKLYRASLSIFDHPEHPNNHNN